MKIYTIKKLIDGHKVRPELRGKALVCCKSTKGYTHIIHDNQLMKLPKTPVTTISFSDKFSRGSYFLDYYVWRPSTPEEVWDGL